MDAILLVSIIFVLIIIIWNMILKLLNIIKGNRFGKYSYYNIPKKVNIKKKRK
jgi:hypothetical protein